MMKIGLVVPSGRYSAMACAVRAASFLAANGKVVYVEPGAMSFLEGYLPLDASAKVDAVVTLGGDGTLLRGAQVAVRSHAPLLGINLGQKGFLAETEPELLESALRALIDGTYEVEMRSILDISVDGVHAGYAMNDAVITRGGYARLIRVRTLVDGEAAGNYRADGLIVATPTGSTGYSLSAGGPIVSPKVSCMIITPVCAHSLQHRPVVVDSAAHITLELGADDEMTADLQIDGQNYAQLHSGQTVDVSQSTRHIRLVRLREAAFFGLVRQKLAEWST